MLRNAPHDIQTHGKAPAKSWTLVLLLLGLLSGAGCSPQATIGPGDADLSAPESTPNPPQHKPKPAPAGPPAVPPSPPPADPHPLDQRHIQALEDAMAALKTFWEQQDKGKKMQELLRANECLLPGGLLSEKEKQTIPQNHQEIAALTTPFVQHVQALLDSQAALIQAIAAERDEVIGEGFKAHTVKRDLDSAQLGDRFREIYVRRSYGYRGHVDAIRQKLGRISYQVKNCHYSALRTTISNIKQEYEVITTTGDLSLLLGIAQQIHKAKNSP